MNDHGDTGGRRAARPGGPRRQLRPTDVKRLNRTWRRETHGRLALIVESVTGPFNVGSIFRTAAAFGVDRIWLAGNATPPDQPQGAEDRARHRPAGPLARSGCPPREAVAAAREDGYRVVAVELTGDAVPLHEADLAGDVCLVVGGEDHGCSPALLEAVDAVCYIPQVGRVGSFNVAVAAAIALAEARRREWAALPGPVPGRA